MVFTTVNMLEIIMLRGIPASGKSTWAKEQLTKYPGKYKRINKDDLRAMLDNDQWSKENEEFVIELRDWVVWNGLARNFSIIVDDTNFNHEHEKVLREIARSMRAQFRIIDFDVPLEVALERNAKRDKPVPEDVIQRMYKQYMQIKKPQ